MIRAPLDPDEAADMLDRLIRWYLREYLSFHAFHSIFTRLYGSELATPLDEHPREMYFDGVYERLVGTDENPEVEMLMDDKHFRAWLSSVART